MVPDRSDQDWAEWAHGGKDRQECLSYPANRVLPVELRADLPDASIVRAVDQTESAAADVAVWIVELSVIENVEEFSSNLECHRFGDSRSLRHAKIRIEKSRAVEETPAGVAKGAEHCVLREGIRQEVTIAAIKAVIAQQLANEMKKKKLTKKRMAELMKTSRAQLDRILDPANGNATIESLQRAAKIVGRELRLELV